MKRLTCPVRFSLAALALLGLAGPARAQQPPQDLVPFKATFTVKFESLMIPLTPPILSQLVTGTGEGDLIGKFTVAAHRTARLGLDGKLIDAGADPGVFSATNGDALFWTTVLTGGGFVITGGKGRFAGVAGSGAITAFDTNAATGETTITWEGMITRPKP
jgi:hypothetical protein